MGAVASAPYACDQWPQVRDELDVLAGCVPLAGLNIVELGCGNARLARGLLQRFIDCRVTGLEVDARQHAKNLQQPQDRLTFVPAGAEQVPAADGTFDLALMLKSLHHVPLASLDQALCEVARVVRPGGWLYVSEPVYDGALNEVVRLYNDEGPVRAAAQAALDRAMVAQPPLWTEVAQHHFAMPVHYRHFDEFEQRMMRPTFADHQLTEAMVERVRAAFEPHATADGAHFVRPMHVRLFRRSAVNAKA